MSSANTRFSTRMENWRVDDLFGHQFTGFAPDPAWVDLDGSALLRRVRREVEPTGGQSSLYRFCVAPFDMRWAYVPKHARSLRPSRGYSYIQNVVPRNPWMVRLAASGTMPPYVTSGLAEGCGLIPQNLSLAKLPESRYRRKYGVLRPNLSKKAESALPEWDIQPQGVFLHVLAML